MIIDNFDFENIKRTYPKFKRSFEQNNNNAEMTTIIVTKIKMWLLAHRYWFAVFFSLLILFFEIVYFDLTSDSILVNLLFELIGVRERTHNNQPTRHHIAIRHNHILLQYIFELFAVVGFLFVTLQSRNLLCLTFFWSKITQK